MGRTRDFEDDQVLKKAMKLFWEKGYEHTSLKELLSTMNILNGSFYNTFGNKKTLFIQALESYYRTLSQGRERLFASPLSFQKKIRAVFHYALDRQNLRDCPKGCFIVNSMSADVLEDEEIRAFVLGYVADFEGFLERHIRLAVENQELDADIDAVRTAAVVNKYFHGLLKLSVLEYTDAEFREQTEFFLSAMRL